MTMIEFAKRARALVLACLLGVAWVPVVHAGPPPWPDGPFSYYAERQPLDRVLQDFASNFSLSLHIGPGYRDVVDGRFNTASPTEFIDRLGGVFGFQWFTHAGTLYVSRNHELVTKALPLHASGGIASLRQALTTLGILDARFGWGELPEQGVVLVSGPPAYVALLESTMSALPGVAPAQQARVFRLEHASVVDRTIRYRDREIRIPGVAQVLQSLIGTSAAGLESVLHDPAGTMTRIAGQSQPVLVEETEAADDTQPRMAGNGAGQGASMPLRQGPGGASIQADPRINAIIVMDRPDRMPLYERLIAMLDVQNALIEIEAMIIDVNISRLEELGIRWSAVGRDGSRGFAFGDVNVQPDGNTISIIGAPRGAQVDPNTLLVSGAAEYFMTRLRALERTGDAEIQSRPSILTEENAEALIDLSETFYVRVAGERVASLTPITAGTTLKVTPRVIRETDDFRIWLAVDIEDGGILDRQIDQVPGIRSSSLSTQAVIRPNESLLVGGYNTEQRLATRDQVPILGDIPLIGGLFSSRSTDVQRRERLFLIRPRILELPGYDLSQIQPSAPTPMALPSVESMREEMEERAAAERETAPSTASDPFESIYFP